MWLKDNLLGNGSQENALELVFRISYIFLGPNLRYFFRMYTTLIYQHCFVVLSFSIKVPVWLSVVVIIIIIKVYQTKKSSLLNTAWNIRILLHAFQ